MCELFGFNSSTPQNITQELKTFFDHSDHNKDGWGLFRDDHNKVLLKEPVMAVKSCKLKQYLKNMTPSSNCIAHIRFGTHGSVSYDNCHPFQLKDISGRTWTLAHNGVVYDETEEVRSFAKIQNGGTDSERLLHLLIKRMNVMLKAYPRMPLLQRCREVELILEEMHYMGWVNLLLWDEEALYAFCNRAGTLCYSIEEGSVMFSSKPICQDKHKWVSMHELSFMVFREGENIYHSNNNLSYCNQSLEEPVYVCHLTKNDLSVHDGYGNFELKSSFEDKMLEEAYNEGWDVEFIFDDGFDPYYLKD